jgi:putative transcriptional regulator
MTAKGQRPRRPRIAAGPSRDADYLDGQCLIAMPGMPDERFRGTVIYLCAHSAEGAMGLVLNQPAEDVSLNDLLVQLDIVASESEIVVPDATRGMPVLKGGPVETGRGFVLHSADYFTESATVPVAEGVSLTHSVEVLRAIAGGVGPRRAMLALGYAGWGAGQLEGEIRANGWLHCGADADLLFGTAPEAKYASALARLGVDLGALSIEAGRA